MKKLLFLLSLLFSTSAWAGTISIQPWTSNNDVTIDHLESQRTTIQNVINGGLDNSNIKTGGIESANEANTISIVKFRDEAFNDFTFSGMLPVTSATLSATSMETALRLILKLTVILLPRIPTHTSTPEDSLTLLR
mgnify:CR=1 FL=1